MIRYVVDRIEEDVVVCENQETGEMENIDFFLLPEFVSEGDFLIYDEDNDEYIVEVSDSSDIEKRMNDLWE